MALENDFLKRAFKRVKVVSLLGSPAQYFR
jgi:hypothetical protein